MNDIVPRKSITSYATQAAGGIIGGIILMSLRDLRFLPALIVGAIIGLAGYGISRSRDDRTVGLIIGGAGILTIFAGIPILGGLAGFLMVVSGIGLIASGAVSLFRFFKGLRSRQ